MKHLVGKSFCICFVFFACLLGCKKDTDSPTPIQGSSVTEQQKALDDPRAVEGNYRLFLTDQTIELGLIERFPKFKVDVMAYGAKNSDGYLTKIKATLIYNPNTLGWIKTLYDKGFPIQIETSKGYILDFANYNLTNKTTDVTVRSNSDGKIIKGPHTLNLSTEFFQAVIAIQQNSGGRIGNELSAICDPSAQKSAKIMGLLANVTSCVIGVVAGLFSEGLVLVSPEGMGLILSCYGAVDGLVEAVTDTGITDRIFGENVGCSLKGASAGVGLSVDCFQTPIKGVLTFIKCSLNLIGAANDGYGCLCPAEKKITGFSTGDPHLTTTDGYHYDFQGWGEFIAVKSTVDNFEVQVRQEDVNNTGAITLNTALAIQAGNDIVCITAKPDQLFINNKLQDLNFSRITLKDGAYLSKQVVDGLNSIDIITKTNDMIRVRFNNNYYLDYMLYLNEERKGKLIGLMGNFDGKAENDLSLRDGGLTQNDFSKLYPTYANSWRIQASQSLFTYPSGKTTYDYTKLDFPQKKPLFTIDVMQKAEALCRAAGIASEPYLNNCIFDMALTNDVSFIKSAFLGQRTESNPQPSITRLIEDSDYTATYTVKNDQLIVNITSSAFFYSYLAIDVNQNNQVDYGIDRIYATGTSVENPKALVFCAVFYSSGTQSCGSAPSNGSLSFTNTSHLYAIPLSELDPTESKKQIYLTMAVGREANAMGTYTYYPSLTGSTNAFSKPLLLTVR